MKPAPQSELLDRIARVRLALKQKKLPAILIRDAVNAYYLTGLKCSNPFVLLTQNSAIFLTDFRYAEVAHRSIEHMEVQIFAQHTLDSIAAAIKKHRLTKVGFESVLPYETWDHLVKLCPKVNWYNSGNLVQTVRQVKSAAEIAIIARNQRLNEKVYLEARTHVRPGMAEHKIRSIVRHLMLDENGDEAFDTIIAAGKHSAEPHANAGSTKVAKGQYLLFDMGVKRDMYHSDMTRTLGIGPKLTARHREIYNVVLQAQIAAMEAIRPGVRCCDVDAIARNFIRDAGYGDYFGHGLGHGVGLQIHEGPTLNARSTEILSENMVVTVEPGIYLPEFGGVRIEDLVVVTASGYRNLTECSKDLEIL